MLLALVVVGLITVIVTQLLGFNVNSSKAFSLYGRQQFTVQDAFSRLNKDIQAASQIYYCNSADGLKFKTIKLYTSQTESSGPVPTITMKSIGQYKLENTELLFRKADGEAFTAIVKGLTDQSTFIYLNQCLTVVLDPEKTSVGNNAMNLDQPLTAEYSLRNKMHGEQAEN